MKTVVGLFRTYDEAERAISELTRLGFTKNEISVAARDSMVTERLKGHDGAARAGAVADKTAGGAVGGAAIGGLAGLLVGLGALVIPGVGPVIAAGTLGTALASAATGAGIGAVAGGLLGALVGLGVPEEEAHVYAEGVKRGGILVTVQAPDDKAGQARSVLNQVGAVDVNTARQEWAQGGWKNFDPNSAPGPDYPTMVSSSAKSTSGAVR